jgi:hypothetical protein
MLIYLNSLWIVGVVIGVLQFALMEEAMMIANVMLRFFISYMRFESFLFFSYFLLLSTPQSEEVAVSHWYHD